MFEKERETAIEAVMKASRLCRLVQEDMLTDQTLEKKDRSPVTVADYGVQAVVSLSLQSVFPQDPLVGEEDASELKDPANAAIKEKVISRVQDVIPDVTEEEIIAAIDRGNHEGGGRGRHWTLDPIDGTKGFLRGDQYAIALALIEDGKVMAGVMGCPHLPVSMKDPDAERGCLFAAVRGGGAIQKSLGGGDEQPVRAHEIEDASQAIFCESVEAAHSSHSDSEKVASLLNVTAEPLRLDSQCKYAALARGDVSIYLRLPTRKDYEEKIWDHAAGSIVCEEAGATVGDVDGKPLDFSLGRTLRENRGVVATTSGIHSKVVSAVKKVLQ